MPWTWAGADAHERGEWVRYHMPSVHHDMRELCRLFRLTREGAAAILDGDDWRPSYERPLNPRNLGTRKTYCKYGHLYTEGNTIWRINNDRPTRRCRSCERERSRKRRESVIYGQTAVGPKLNDADI